MSLDDGLVIVGLVLVISGFALLAWPMALVAGGTTLVLVGLWRSFGAK